MDTKFIKNFFLLITQGSFVTKKEIKVIMQITCQIRLINFTEKFSLIRLKTFAVL